MSHRIFIANRGEVAVRIIDACDRLGFETVLGISSADGDTLGARRAGRSVKLGAAAAVRSYLNAEAVVQAALSTGCGAVHPGYGFLSERAELAELCARYGLTFIGPSPHALRSLGDKLTARHLAASAGVPIADGGTEESLSGVQRLAERIGYPVLIKAAYGGGGRGMKIVERRADLAGAWEVAASEALAAFGNGTVFLERFMQDAKHVEVQIIGDRFGHCVHVGERECSVQYRHQKVIEEAPCLALTAEARDSLVSGALAIARTIGYVGLGTVEFLYDTNTNRGCFLEVNPRLQVEHPVTEAVSGVDLVREQLLVALGEPLGFEQNDISVRGHAIEARITAQDPDRGLQPSPGVVTRWRPPAGGGLRLDSHVYEGYRFPPFYDALMGKLIGWGPDRSSAIDTLQDGLDRFVVEGISTSLPLLRRILAHADFQSDVVTTNWLTDALSALAV